MRAPCPAPSTRSIVGVWGVTNALFRKHIAEATIVPAGLVVIRPAIGTGSSTLIAESNGLQANGYRALTMQIAIGTYSKEVISMMMISVIHRGHNDRYARRTTVPSKELMFALFEELTLAGEMVLSAAYVPE